MDNQRHQHNNRGRQGQRSRRGRQDGQRGAASSTNTVPLGTRTDIANDNATQRFLQEERHTLMRGQDTEYDTARANDLAHNERQDQEQATVEARETLEASADYHHQVDHAVVRSARLARLSVEHGCANPT